MIKSMNKETGGEICMHLFYDPMATLINNGKGFMDITVFFCS